jgi:adenylate cyclase class 2
MNYEVELKFRLVERQSIEALLVGMGAAIGIPIHQEDQYFNHPSRDFRASDEAFRIRTVGEQNCLTYKGPVIDKETKMRREIEIGFANGVTGSEQMSEMLTALGFRSVHCVRKIRTPWTLDWNGRRFDLAIDVVPTVGTFVEIELIADDAGRDVARDSILELAQQLNLNQPEKRSYLELVLAAGS